MAVNEAIDALKAALPNLSIHASDSNGYTERNKTYLSAFETDLKPAFIIAPKSTDDVSIILKTLNPWTKNASVPFAVRGGGQQPTPGCANVEGGITIDLHLLTGIEVNSDSVSVAAGERWGAVYNKLDKVGKGVNGSRASTGGIGGLALEGGHSFFSSREGFVCDSVLNYEIVLADGTVTNANSKENPDLWRALKGAANNLGIVTRFELQTFEQGNFWGGNVFYFPPSFPSQIEALAKEVNSQNADADSHLMVSIGYAAEFKQTMCQNQIYYSKTEEKPAALDPFATIQPQIDQLNSLRLASLKTFADEQAGLTSYGKRCAYMNTTLKAETSILQSATDIYTNAIEALKPLDGLICSLTFEPIPVSLMKKSESLGGNSLGLKSSNGPLILVLLLTYWKDSADDTKVVDTMKEVITKIDQEAEKAGHSGQFKYMNYSWTHQDPIASYGSEQRKKLQAISKQYDPDGVFQKAVKGPFKLF